LISPPESSRQFVRFRVGIPGKTCDADGRSVLKTVTVPFPCEKQALKMGAEHAID
jgi:hypothetical protein